MKPNQLFLDIVEKVENNLKQALEKITIKPVIYDEVEYFSNSYIDYPFKSRKSNL